MRTRKNSNAFTLIEMVVVLVVLGILAALAIPTFQSVVENSRVEGTRLAAESLANEVSGLVSLAQGQNAATGNDDAAVWADAVADLDPTVTLWDGETAYTGAATAPATLTVRKAYGDADYDCTLTVATLAVSGCAASGSAGGAGAPTTTTTPPTTTTTPPTEQLDASGPPVIGEFRDDLFTLFGNGFDDSFTAPRSNPSGSTVTITSSHPGSASVVVSPATAATIDRQTSYWSSDTFDNGVWVQYDFGATRTVTPTGASLIWYGVTNQTSIQGSNDASTWTTLWTSPDNSWADGVSYHAPTWSNTTAYRYVRLNHPVLNTFGGTGRWSIMEFQLFGSATIPAPTAPGSVQSLAATPSHTSVALTWSAPESDGGRTITDYLVEVSSNGGSSWTTFADGSSATTGTTVTGLTPETAYQFRVTAVNSVGNGSSSTVSATTTATPAEVTLTSGSPPADGFSSFTYNDIFTLFGNGFDDTFTSPWSNPAGSTVTITSSGLNAGAGTAVTINHTTYAQDSQYVAWVSASGWITYDFGENRTVIPTGMAGEFFNATASDRIEGSNDGTNWTTLWEWGTTPPAETFVKKSATWANTTGYRYVRYTHPTAHPAWVDIFEFQLFGTVVCPSTGCNA